MITIANLKSEIEKHLHEAFMAVIDQELNEMEEASKKKIAAFYGEQRYRCKEFVRQLTVEMLEDRALGKITVEVKG